jgi:isopenicillin-N epimerase
MDPSIFYLNTGTSGLISKAVYQRAMDFRARLYRDPTDAVWRSPWDELWQSRKRLAVHLKTTPDRLVLFQNISHAINTFCNSVDFPPGSEVVLTDHEYGSMRHAWERAASRRGWKLCTVRLPILAADPQPADPQQYIDSIAGQLGRNTRLLYLSHVLYSTGLVLPLAEICRIARKRDVLVFVDGAHAPGMLPLDLTSLGAHFYAANLHKWFMAPVGAAFLYVEHGYERHLEPWQVSWGYHDDRTHPNQRNEFGSTPWIRQFEMEGTRDTTPWLTLALCCDFLESIGYAKILERHYELSNRVRNSLDGLFGLRLVTPNHRSLRGGLTAFAVPEGYNGHALRSRLWTNQRVEVNLVELDARQYLRVSTHVYNTELEVEALEQAIRAEWNA